MNQINPVYFNRFQEGLEVCEGDENNTPVDHTSERYRLWCGMDMYVIHTGNVPPVQAAVEHTAVMGYVSDMDPVEEHRLWLRYHTEAGHLQQVQVDPEFEAGPIGDL